MGQKDGVGEIDPLRWELYRRRDARNGREIDKMTLYGYLMENLEHFDRSFFSISLKDAEMSDPQQRSSLEVCWEALERDSTPPQSLLGSNTISLLLGVSMPRIDPV